MRTFFLALPVWMIWTVWTNAFLFLPGVQSAQAIPRRSPETTKQTPNAQPESRVYIRAVANGNSAIVACYDNYNQEACNDLVQLKRALMSGCGAGDVIACNSAKYILEMEQSGSVRRMLDQL
jgi:hypothetical protein